MIDLNNKNVLLSNLSFDHPLTSIEVNDLINILSSPILLGQVYFRGDIDIKSIEKIKLLLEGMPNIDDSKVEKYIMKSIDTSEKEKINNMNFLNIDTWNIAYSVGVNQFSITSLSKYRLINEWFNSTIKEMNDDFSPMEKICCLYDKVKLFEYSEEKKYGRVPEIISENKANSYGYNLLFKELLTILDIPAIIESYETDDGINYVTLAKIKDSKHDIDGVYLFDPSSDTILKDQYKNNLARRMNYNFFAITLDKLRSLRGNVKPNGLLKPLMSINEEEYKFYLDKYMKRHTIKECSEIEKKFDMPIDQIYLKILNSMNLNDDIRFEIINCRIDEFSQNIKNKDAIKKTLFDNYIDRDRELFEQNSVKLKSKTEFINAS